MGLMRFAWIFFVFFLIGSRASAQADPFVACRLRLPRDIATELSKKSEQEQKQWLAGHCDEVSLAYLECSGGLSKKQRDDYALAPSHLKSAWLKSHCKGRRPGRLPTAPNAESSLSGVVAMVGASGGPRFTDEDRKQMHDIVLEVSTAALAPRQMDVVAAHQISGAPCDKKARQQTAQAQNATAVLCFHSMAQGQDTVVSLALYDASNDRVIRSVVLPVAGAHAADIALPLQTAAKELLSEATSTTPQEPKPSIVFEPSERDRGKPRPWVTLRATGWIFLGSGLASLVPGLVIGGLSKFQDAPQWVPSVFVGGACTLLGAALLARSSNQKRVSQEIALIPLRGGAALGWSHSF